METGRTQGPSPLGHPQEPFHQPGVKRVLASDLAPLVEFIAARVTAVHRCNQFTSKETAAEICAPRHEHDSRCTIDGDEASEEHEQTTEPWRVLVAIGGIPGSGKSTLAARLQAALNAEARTRFCECLLDTPKGQVRNASPHVPNLSDAAKNAEPVGIVTLDGFHLTRAELDRFPDPAEAHRRRGAPWTFNLRAFWAALRTLKSKAGPVTFPTFDHAVKDPDSHGCVVAEGTRVVLVEGLYTLVAEEGSSAGPDLFDAQIFIDTPKSAPHGSQHARGVQMCLARATKVARPAADL